LREKSFKDLGVDGRIILKWIFKIWDGEAWTMNDLVPDRKRWRVVVNVVMNFRVP
jgi:hypothetical protein